MKSAVVFYSWSGHSAKAAREWAEKEGAELIEVKDRNRPGTLKAYTAGCLAAMGMKRTAIVPLNSSLEEYDRIIFLAPVWAGYPAPAILSAFDLLPRDKEVAVGMVSSSGASRCREKIKQLVESKGCRLVDFQNIKG